MEHIESLNTRKSLIFLRYIYIFIMCHVSHVERPMSHVMCHMCPVTSHMLLVTNANIHIHSHIPLQTPQLSTVGSYKMLFKTQKNGPNIPKIYHSIHSPLQRRGLYKSFSFRFCMCSGGLKVTIDCVQRVLKQFIYLLPQTSTNTLCHTRGTEIVTGQLSN